MAKLSGKEIYARRIAREMAKGKTRQQARGHREGESKRRRVRETALGGLTSQQKSQVRKFALAQAARNDGLTDEDEIAEFVAGLLRYATREGYDAFVKNVRGVQQALAKTYARERANDTYVIREGSLDYYVREANAPEALTRWYFYH